MNKQIAALATDEDHMVMWDIDSVLSDYGKQPGSMVNTELLIPKNWLTIDTQYAMTTDTGKPIILFELPDRQLFIADGNHRLYRAAKENIPQMSVIILPQEEHLKYLFESTTEAYYRVIDGLKGEGVFINSFAR